MCSRDLSVSLAIGFVLWTLIPVEKRAHPSIWILPAHLIPLGKLQRCLVRTEAKAWLSLANRQLQLEFCFSSGAGQDSQGHEGFRRCYLAFD